MSDDRTPRRVVLLGGGYVTLHAYGAIVRRLHRAVRRGQVEIVVVSADDVHNFHGFTGEVAAGRLPAHLTQTPLVEAMPRARVLHARVRHVDLHRQAVTYAPVDGSAEDSVRYDALVVGTGAAEPLDAVAGLVDRAVTLRRPGGLRALAEQAATAGDDGRPVVVIGGGLAGVELAAALADRVGPALPPSVVLVHGGDRVVPALHDEHPRLAARCAAELSRLAVDVRTGTRVVAADDDGVTLSDGSTIPAGTVLATTGQRPVPLPGLEPLARDARGRLLTQRDLRVTPVGARPPSNVWAAGDAAAVQHPRTGLPVPANALWAIKAGDRVGRNVARTLRDRPGRPFRYLGLGSAASFGTGRGIASLYGVPITGWAAWLLRLGFFLRFMPSPSRAARIPFALARARSARAAHTPRHRAVAVRA
ncbi:FAD-dependent oxidoreductase [Cellulomonas sp.]|uniref:NAD(P)/FAD-dependent oxidoreductase n=1 Tax=Cellulomonas sp. TaxID=40001 RepID=UPI001B1F09D0|nr:FAD-dependent oxidoreductase [Cellulomonas sp.]MBO9554596.1 FAD-dependent oxidoreductase [Cellulomonas sp.]